MSSATAERLASKSLQDQRPWQLCGESPRRFSKFLRGCEPMAHRSGILKRCGAILFPGPYQFDSEPPEGTLRSSVVHSPGRASSNPLAWLASIGALYSI
jgi:hypothetical protein